jgi:hypothetical protein
MKEWAIAAALGFVAFLAPIQGVMIATGFLIFVDTFTGIWRSLKAGQRITSGKLGTTLSKLVLYQVLIVTALVMQLHLIPLIPVVSLVAAAIAAREGLSVFENVSSITGTDFVSLLIEKLHPGRKDDK